jgi:hypothetical protein
MGRLPRARASAVLGAVVFLATMNRSSAVDIFLIRINKYQAVILWIFFLHRMQAFVPTTFLA